MMVHSLWIEIERIPGSPPLFPTPFYSIDFRFDPPSRSLLLTIKSRLFVVARARSNRGDSSSLDFESIANPIRFDEYFRPRHSDTFDRIRRGILFTLAGQDRDANDRGRGRRQRCCCVLKKYSHIRERFLRSFLAST